MPSIGKIKIEATLKSPVLKIPFAVLTELFKGKEYDFKKQTRHFLIDYDFQNHKVIITPFEEEGLYTTPGWIAGPGGKTLHFRIGKFLEKLSSKEKINLLKKAVDKEYKAFVRKGRPRKLVFRLRKVQE